MRCKSCDSSEDARWRIRLLWDTLARLRRQHPDWTWWEIDEAAQREMDGKRARS